MVTVLHRLALHPEEIKPEIQTVSGVGLPGTHTELLHRVIYATTAAMLKSCITSPLIVRLCIPSASRGVLADSKRFVRNSHRTKCRAEAVLLTEIIGHWKRVNSVGSQCDVTEGIDTFLRQ